MAELLSVGRIECSTTTTRQLTLTHLSLCAHTECEYTDKHGIKKTHKYTWMEMTRAHTDIVENTMHALGSGSSPFCPWNPSTLSLFHPVLSELFSSAHCSALTDHTTRSVCVSLSACMRVCEGINNLCIKSSVCCFPCLTLSARFLYFLKILFIYVFLFFQNYPYLIHHGLHDRFIEILLNVLFFA